MDLLDVEISPEKVLNGVWANIDEDTSLLIARYANSNFKKAVSKYQEMFSGEVVNGKYPKETQEKITNYAIAEGILIDWKGMKYGGEEIEYSVENAYRFLSDPRLDDFREYVLIKSMQTKLYRNEDIEKAKE